MFRSSTDIKDTINRHLNYEKLFNQVPSRAFENSEKTFCITNRLLYNIIITMMSTVSTSRAPTTASTPPTTPPIVEPDTAVKETKQSITVV